MLQCMAKRHMTMADPGAWWAHAFVNLRNFCFSYIFLNVPQYVSTIHFISMLSDGGTATETTVKCLPIPLSSDVMIQNCDSGIYVVLWRAPFEVLCAPKLPFLDPPLHDLGLRCGSL